MRGVERQAPRLSAFAPIKTAYPLGAEVWAGVYRRADSWIYEFCPLVLSGLSDIRKISAHIGDDLPDLLVGEGFLESRHLAAELRATF